MNQRFPFSPFPNGWFRVAYSDELTLKKVVPLHYFGKDLVLFRTEDGTPHVFDAQCPHLGAHLEYGGRVEKNTIQCPFHGWSFNQEGACVQIPCAKNIPLKAQIRSWPVREINGLIMVYYDAKGEPPSWELPKIPQWNEAEWTSFKKRRWKIRTHPQEMAENAMDNAHMTFLHHQTFRGVKNPSNEINGAVFIRRLFPKYYLPLIAKFGTEAEGFLEVTCYGLGWQIGYSFLKVMLELEAISMFLPTPIDNEYIDVNVLVSVKKLFNPLVTRAFEKKMIKEVCSNLEQDIPIWENKVYCSKPLLSEADGPIMQYRHWAQQFYSHVPVKITENLAV